MRKCNKLFLVASIPLIGGIMIVLSGMLSLLVPMCVSVSTGDDPSIYINVGKYMIFGGYDQLINFISLGLMLITFGIVMGGIVIVVIEPIIKHLQKT